jgi:multidrug resistance efflux pump
MLVRRLWPWALLLLLAVGLELTPWTLHVSGECLVLPLERAEIRAEADGILARIDVSEGQRVAAGQVVATLDDREVQASIRRAQAEADAFAANLLKHKHGNPRSEVARAAVDVAAREHDLAFAKVTANRQQQLFSEGVDSEEHRDDARREVEVKESALAQARAQLQLLRSGYRSEEIAISEAELRQAEAELAYQRKRLTLLTIRSPIAGVVTTPRLSERLNERLSAGAPFCEVADLKRVRVEIFVPERFFDVIQLGQPLAVKVEGYPRARFTGKVTWISPAVEDRGGDRVLRVVSELDNPDGILRERMSGYADIDAGRSRALHLLVRSLVRWVRVRYLV